jgi:hypothetical protein
MRNHKSCWSIRTAGRWPWKSESAKECVTTHLPNRLALKMDGAEASGLYRAAGSVARLWRVEEDPASRRVVEVRVEASGVSPRGAAPSADLGGSSKYSNENFEGRSGEGFHVNSS